MRLTASSGHNADDEKFDFDLFYPQANVPAYKILNPDVVDNEKADAADDPVGDDNDDDYYYNQQMVRNRSGKTA